ncbi:methyltransferase domain-containing protein [Halomonas vilamensis]|uniref:Methyltransferase domain-containing protein n=1 Tax=Vreelandella vilamensis TaxID=531309 RepID=A0ABU1H3S7_9GAMM|nr:methyltransferase domain-containing protein [Halomonas vilamensis]MDR5898317.1 methyltransferase domain-containing protein [Halomonas vilamensis]
MSNSHTADSLTQRLKHSQRFWASDAGKKLSEVQRACLGPVIEARTGGHSLEMTMGPSLLNLSSVPHVIEWVPSRAYARQASSLICPPSELALPDGCLDICLIHHWLEHVPDAEKTLQEAARLTADHGILVIFGFNPVGLSNLTRRLLPGRHSFPRNDTKTHSERAHWHGTSQLTQWLESVDFTVERVDYCGFYGPLFCSAKKSRCRETWEAWGRRLNVPLGESYMIQAKRQQPQAPAQRVQFGVNPAAATHSLGVARGSNRLAADRRQQHLANQSTVDHNEEPKR